MQPPYSKARLSKLHQEYYAQEINSYVNDIADIIGSQVVSRAIAISKQPPPGVVYIGEQNIQKNVTIYFRHVLNQSKRHLEQPKESYIPQIIEALRERFPDSVIQIDPLKTYVHIDWS